MIYLLCFFPSSLTPIRNLHFEMTTNLEGIANAGEYGAFGTEGELDLFTGFRVCKGTVNNHIVT